MILFPEISIDFSGVIDGIKGLQHLDHLAILLPQSFIETLILMIR